MTKPQKTPEQLATEHWDWLETFLRKTYIDAFVHGYKHGKESNEQSIRRALSKR